MEILEKLLDLLFKLLRIEIEQKPPCCHLVWVLPDKIKIGRWQRMRPMCKLALKTKPTCGGFFEDKPCCGRYNGLEGARDDVPST